MKDEGREFLWRQLDRLGQMIADGLADESDGKWIRQQYRETAITLGIAKPSDFRKPRKNHSKQINYFMAERVKVVKCRNCGGDLVQSRKGSLVANCNTCGARYRLGRRGRK
jgi:hypothetical protein